jgi:hypothetical protein
MVLAPQTQEQEKEVEGTMEIEALLRRVRAEFEEMPGLRLTPAQATRMWGLEENACDTVINALVASSFLRWTASGSIARADGS